jgi:hypothetical protein
MNVGPLFMDFLQRIAIGAGVVFALILIVGVGLRSRSAIGASRRATN